MFTHLNRGGTLAAALALVLCKGHLVVADTLQDVSFQNHGVSASCVVTGNPVTFTPTVFIPSGATNPIFRDVVPAGLTGIPSQPPISPAGTCQYFDCYRVVQCTGLATGQTSTVTISGTASIAGGMTNRASAYADATDPNTANNVSEASISVGTCGITLAGC